MNYSDGALSPSDVALITGNTGNNGNNNGWGDNGAWQKSAKGKSRY